MNLVSSVLAGVWLTLAACDSRLDLGRNAAGASTDDDNAAGNRTSDASECDRVCTRVIACGLVEQSQRAQCLDTCTGGSNASERTCILQTSCALMRQVCGLSSDQTEIDVPSGGGSGSSTFAIRVCQDACDTAKFQDCLDAAAHADCRDLCSTAAATPRDTFASCVQSSGECSALDDCYQVFAN